MPIEKKITLTHDDIVKLIKKQSDDARELALEEKRKLLRRNPKKLQKILKKPLNVLQKTYETEKQIARDKRKKGVTMLSIIKETYELVKEFVTLKSPVEVYIFVGGVWLTGVGVGTLLG